MNCYFRMLSIENQEVSNQPRKQYMSDSDAEGVRLTVRSVVGLLLPNRSLDRKAKSWYDDLAVAPKRIGPSRGWYGYLCFVHPVFLCCFLLHGSLPLYAAPLTCLQNLQQEGPSGNQEIHLF